MMTWLTVQERLIPRGYYHSLIGGLEKKTLNGQLIVRLYLSISIIPVLYYVLTVRAGTGGLSVVSEVTIPGYGWWLSSVCGGGCCCRLCWF